MAANEAAAAGGNRIGDGASAGGAICGVEIRQRSRAQEKAAHAALLDIGWSVSPRIEDTAPDTIVLDLAGLTFLIRL